MKLYAIRETTGIEEMEGIGDGGSRKRRTSTKANCNSD